MLFILAMKILHTSDLSEVMTRDFVYFNVNVDTLSCSRHHLCTTPLIPLNTNGQLAFHRTLAGTFCNVFRVHQVSFGSSVYFDAF